MPGSKGSIRMICSNPQCINKSVVFRKYGSDKTDCNACGSKLIKAKNSLAEKQDEKAKRELREFGVI